MAIIEQRLAEMGLELPEPLKVREGLHMPFAWVRVRGTRAYISGHVACNRDGTLAAPLARSERMFRQSRVTRQPGSLPWPISPVSNVLSETLIGSRLGCASSPW